MVPLRIKIVIRIDKLPKNSNYNQTGYDRPHTTRHKETHNTVGKDVHRPISTILRSGK
jgi:hypothetical protein